MRTAMIFFMGLVVGSCVAKFMMDGNFYYGLVLLISWISFSAVFIGGGFNA